MNPITLTDAAIAHIKKMVDAKPNAKGFFVKIKKTGCSGYSYVPEVTDEVPLNAMHYVTKDLPVFIDNDALNFLDGVLIDFVVEQNEGLKQKRLIFINPKETGRCGCGESFTVD